MLMEARLLDERREGEAVDIAKGKEIGLVEGEAIGLAKGESIGLAKEKLATAKCMLVKGCYSLEDIAELTSLPIEQITALKEDQQS